jgi:hypothetical protein
VCVYLWPFSGALYLLLQMTTRTKKHNEKGLFFFFGLFREHFLFFFR